MVEPATSSLPMVLAKRSPRFAAGNIFGQLVTMRHSWRCCGVARGCRYRCHRRRRGHAAHRGLGKFTSLKFSPLLVLQTAKAPLYGVVDLDLLARASRRACYRPGRCLVKAVRMRDTAEKRKVVGLAALCDASGQRAWLRQVHRHKGLHLTRRSRRLRRHFAATRRIAHVAWWRSWQAPIERALWMLLPRQRRRTQKVFCVHFQEILRDPALQ